jgi:hypothetical protein
VLGVALRGDGRLLALTSPPGKARVVLVDPRGAAPATLFEAPLEAEKLCASLAVAPDGRLVVCAGYSSTPRKRTTLLVWREGQEVPARLELEGEASALVLQEDGRRLLVAWGVSEGQGGVDSQGGVVRVALDGPAPRVVDEVALSQADLAGQCTALAVSDEAVALGDSGSKRVALLDPATLAPRAAQPVAEDIEESERAMGDVPLAGFGAPVAAHRAAVCALHLDGAGRLWSVSADDRADRNRERGNEVRVWRLADAAAAGGLVGWQAYLRALDVHAGAGLVLIGLLPFEQGGPQVQLWHADAFLGGLRPIPEGGAFTPR